MAFLKKVFPMSFIANDNKRLVISLAFYFIADLVCGIILSFLISLDGIGPFFSIVADGLGLYFFLGLLFSVAYFIGILKDKG